jgi:hypothetical protein
MSREINFLEERRKRVTKLNKTDQKLFEWTIIGFSVTLVICIIVLAVSFFLNRQLTQIQADQETTKNQILNNQSTERSFVLFVHKLSALAQIYQNRQDKKEAIRYFTRVFGPDVLINQIEFDQTTKLIQFQLQSKDVFTLEKVMNILTSDEVRQKFTSVNPSDLSRLPNGRYQLSLSVVTPPATP